MALREGKVREAWSSAVRCLLRTTSFPWERPRSKRKVRFIVERKGKPVMAMVSLEDLQKLEQIPEKKMSRGVLAAIGAWEDFENLDEVVAEIYRARALS
jgi:putative SOS response-associated peptidase YedK